MTELEQTKNTFRFRLFCIMAVAQCVGNTLGVLLNLIMQGMNFVIFFNSFLCILTYVVVFLTIRKRKIEMGIIILLIICSVFEFPMLYIFTDKSALGYFILTYVQIGLFCSARRRVPIFLGVLAIDLAAITAAPHLPMYPAKMAPAPYSFLPSFLVAAFASFMLVVSLTRQYEKLNEELLKKSTELAKLNDYLAASEKEALQASETKSSFLANMSHEIRTPINCVIGMNEMILRESEDAEVQAYSQDVADSSKILLELINQILDISKIESGKMEIVPEHYELRELIRELVKMVASRAQDKGLEFKLAVSPNLPNALYGDDFRLKQIILNLLTNAVKYTEKGSFTLHMDGERVDGKLKLTVKVTDTGIGIKEENIPKLFDAYTRFDSKRNKGIEGTGLGMGITTKLLECMDSKLEVHSTYGVGSEFSFTLLQEITEDTPIGEITEKHHSAEKHNYHEMFTAPDAKVLVVDDNDMNRRVFRALLKKTKMQITEAKSGEEALRLAQQNRFDMIFLDHMMPGMDGIETLHCIRKIEDCPCKDIPIVALTANAMSGAREKYMSEGFDDFLTKPIDWVRMEELIYHFLPQEKIEKES